MLISIHMFLRGIILILISSKIVCVVRFWATDTGFSGLCRHQLGRGLHQHCHWQLLLDLLQLLHYCSGWLVDAVFLNALIVDRRKLMVVGKLLKGSRLLCSAAKALSLLVFVSGRLGGVAASAWTLHVGLAIAQYAAGFWFVQYRNRLIDTLETLCVIASTWCSVYTDGNGVDCLSTLWIPAVRVYQVPTSACSSSSQTSCCWGSLVAFGTPHPLAVSVWLFDDL